MNGAYRTIDVIPVTGALGAEVTGVDLSRDDLGDDVMGDIHQAFLDHLVLFFRDQTLTPPQQAAFARHFGRLAPYLFLEGLKEEPDVIEILKTEQDENNFGGDWHSDTAYLETPALGTMLYAREVPAAGGDTLFANMYLAYESLSERMRQMLDGLIGINSGANTAGGSRAQYMQQQHGLKERNVDVAPGLEAEHPIVRSHPKTGRKALYLNPIHTVCLKGMTEEESKPLLSYLCAHAVKPQFTCRFRWTNGAIAFWDNRCTQHFAINDYPGQRRRMHRVTIEGDRPFA